MINIGNDDITEVTIDGVTVTEVTIDGDVVWTASTGPTIVEDFEEGDWAGYGGNDANYSIINNTTNAYNGDHYLELGDSGGFVYSLQKTFAKGEKSRVHVYQENSDTERCWVYFGVNDSANNNGVLIDFRYGGFGLYERTGGTQTEINYDGSPSLSADIWYYVDITWDDGTLGGSDNDVTIELYEEATDTLVSNMTYNITANQAYDGTAYLHDGQNLNNVRVDYWIKDFE